jgi:hypothetical protein
LFVLGLIAFFYEKHEFKQSVNFQVKKHPYLWFVMALCLSACGEPPFPVPPCPPSGEISFIHVAHTRSKDSDGLNQYIEGRDFSGYDI